MPFLKEPPPCRGQPLAVAPGIWRIVANNPHVMTYHGTNTYLIEDQGGLIVLDPGPDDDAHVAAVMEATAGRITAILVSHAHADHIGALGKLRGRVKAPVYAFRPYEGSPLQPDLTVADGDYAAGLQALHTPGHARDHLCFARADGILFTADHVMSWSSSIVSPPDGNMADYCESLRLLLARNDRLYLPGHGPPLPEPQPYVRELLEHRIRREERILSVLSKERLTVPELAEKLYAKTDPLLQMAAERNVVAHLDKLQAEGAAAYDGEVWRAA